MCIQCPPIRVKKTSMNEILNSSSDSSVMTIKSILKIFGKKWGENRIPETVDIGVYICSCTVTNIKTFHTKRHAFFYNVHFSYLIHLLENRQKYDSVATHIEQNFESTMSRTDLHTCMDQFSTILKNLRNKHVMLMNKDFRHKTNFHQIFLSFV